jgi:hypothetical protein
MVFESDLFLIQKLAFPEAKTIIVIDPGKVAVSNYKSNFIHVSRKDEIKKMSFLENKFVIFNLSGADTFSIPIKFDKVEGIVSFSGSDETSEEFYCGNLYYTLNENNSFRWLISQDHTTADFLFDLHTYGKLTDMSNLFSSYKSVMNYFRVKNRNLRKVTDGNIQIIKREKHFFDELSDLTYDSFITRLDSCYLNNILEIKYYENGKRKFNLKKAINNIGQIKLENEHKALNELAKHDFQNFEVPEIVRNNKSLITVVKPDLKSTDYYKVKKLIYNRFLIGIKEYYSKFNSTNSVKKILKGEKIISLMQDIENRIRQRQLPKGISLINLGNLYKKLITIINEIDIERQIPVSLNNNNLNPDYIGYSPEKIYFLNWENAKFDHPLLFDLFEYNFVHIEEWENPQSHFLVNDIEALKDHDEIQSLIATYNLDFELHLKLYLLIRLSNELSAIISKKVIYPETNLKIFFWLEFMIEYDAMLED